MVHFKNKGISKIGKNSSVHFKYEGTSQKSNNLFVCLLVGLFDYLFVCLFELMLY